MEKLKSIDIVNVNGSFIFSKKKPGYLAQYARYVINTITEIASEVNLNANIFYDVQEFDLSNDKKNISIYSNFEHCAVREDKESEIKVRFLNWQKMKKKDIILDYTKSNVNFVASDKSYEYISSKHIYFPPLVYQDFSISKDNIEFDIFTSWIKSNPRRDALKDMLSKYERYANIGGRYTNEEWFDVYKKSKILFNARRTDEFLTFEELRVLPALQNGMIVICEHSWFDESIPFYDMIIWSKYSDFDEKIKDALSNYDHYMSKIFSDKNIELLKSLRSESVNDLKNLILSKI